MARAMAVSFSLLSLLLNTAGASGVFPEFDSCPEHLAHELREHAAFGLDQLGAHQSFPAMHSHSDAGAIQVVFSDGDNDFCDCCQGFFLAHLSGIPVAVTIPAFPDRRVDHSELCQMALEFTDAPPVPPPKPYLV